MNQNINGITNVPSNATNNNYIYLLYAKICKKQSIFYK